MTVRPGKGKPKAERRFDRTYLHQSTHGRLVHRDYAAHYFRWGFAFKFCAKRRTLDVGCGPEYQLGRVLCHHGGLDKKPEIYVGVDYNKIKNKPNNKNLKIIDETDFTTEYLKIIEEFGLFEVAVCYEVIEHMAPKDGRRLLLAIKDSLKDDGVLLLSTPVLRHRQAANHIHEYGIDELAEFIRSCGLSVQDRFGTYGDVPALAKAASPEHKKVMRELQSYYSHDVISCFLAPLYPDVCKNNLWVVTKTEY